MPKKKETRNLVHHLKEHPNPKKQTDIFDEVQSGLGARLNPGGSVSFFYRYRMGGKTRRYTFGNYPAMNVSAARDRVRELSVDVKNGKDPAGEKRRKRSGDSSALTFAGLVEEFIEKHLPDLREATRYEYVRHLENDVLPAIGDTPAGEVTREDVQKVLDKVAFTRGAKVQANRVRTTVSSVFSFGVKRGLLSENVAIKTPTFSEHNDEREPRRAYEPDELRRLWPAFDTIAPQPGNLMRLILLLGQRIGETSRMKWSDIHGDIWQIPTANTKGKRYHEVPLTSHALEVIRSLPEKSDFVFQSTKVPNQPIGKWQSRNYARVSEAAGVKGFEGHALRHSLTTQMHALGVPGHVVSRLLNHSDGSTGNVVTQIYNHHTYLPEMREAMETWHGHLFEHVLEA